MADPASVIVPPVATPTPAAPAAEPAPAPATPAPAAAPAKPEPSPAAKARELSNAHAARAAAEAKNKQLEQELATARAEAKGVSAKLDRFKSDPMGALEAVGMTYEQITQAAIQRHGKDTPAARIEAIEAKIKADESARAKYQEEQQREYQQRAVQAKVAEYVNGVHAHAIADKATYELLSASDPGYAKDLIYNVADEFSRRAGRVPTSKEVCDMIEEHLVGEGVKYAASAKVKAKLAPPAPAPIVGAPPTIDNPAVRAAVDAQKARQVPRTLTNRLAAAPVADKPPEPGKKLSPQEAMRAAMAVYREQKEKNP